MTALAQFLLSCLLWRARGVLGAPFTVLFSLVQAWTLWPVLGLWSLLFAAWVAIGELSGWKPKLIVDRGEWWRAVFTGLLIGGIGVVALPLSTWLHIRFDEPPFPNNPRPFYRPAWLPLQSRLIPAWTDTQPKYLLDWRGAWNEAYFGAIFSLILTLVTGAL